MEYITLTYTSRKKKLVALFFACLGFVGAGGMQYFYVGRYLRGILYFLTVGVFGIGTIVDCILLLLGKFKDSRGIPLKL